MKALLVQYAARFDALSLRERLLVFAGCVAVTGLVLFAWLFDPIARERTQLTDRIGTQQRMLATTHAGVQSLLGNQSDPDATARARSAKASVVSAPRSIRSLKAPHAGSSPRSAWRCCSRHW